MEQQSFKEMMNLAHEIKILATHFGHHDRLQSHEGLSDEGCFVRLALYVKSIDLYHSILFLLHNRLDESSEILCRSLFETQMAFEFLCRRSVRLWGQGNNRRIPVDLFGKKLTREFRTLLYIAHCTLEDRRWLEMAGPLGHVKDWRESKRLKDRELAESESEIGADWMRRLSKSHSYSGLTIYQLACCLGDKTRRWYNAVYRNQSSAAHAGDARSFVAWDENGNITSPKTEEPEKSMLVLNLSTCIFFSVLLRFGKTFEVTAEQYERFVQLSMQFTEQPE